MYKVNINKRKTNKFGRVPHFLKVKKRLILHINFRKMSLQNNQADICQKLEDFLDVSRHFLNRSFLLYLEGRRLLRCRRTLRGRESAWRGRDSGRRKEGTAGALTTSTALCQITVATFVQFHTFILLL